MYTIRDTINTPLNVFLEFSRFGAKSLNKLRSDIKAYIAYQTTQKNEFSYGNSLFDFILTLCKIAGVSEDHSLMVLEKICGNNNAPSTLDEVSNQFDCTRERVRQIVKSTFEMLKKSYKTKMFIDQFRKIHIFITKNSGGVIGINEMASRIAEKMLWPSLDEEALIEYLKYIPIENGVKFNNGIFYINSVCRKCDTIAFALKQLVECDFGGCIKFSELKKITNRMCDPAKAGNCNYDNSLDFSIEFIKHQVEKVNFKYDNNIIYTKRVWLLQTGGLRKRVEVILLDSPCSLTPDAVCRVLNNELSVNYDVKKIHTALINSPSCVVWGRGEFIHKKNIVCSEDILKTISTALDDKLVSVPFLALKGIYEEYRVKFKKARIPNEYALSTIIDLKVSNYHVDRYRYVHTEIPENGTSIDSYIEQWILDAGEAIRRSDLSNHLISSIGLRKSLVNLALNRITAVIPEKRGRLIHVDNLNIKKEQLLPLEQFITSELKKHLQIGVSKVFNENKVYLTQLRIANSRMLYGILQNYCSDIYSFPRFPHISIMGEDISVTLTQALSNYVYKKMSVVTVDECADYFEQKGYSPIQTRARIGGLSYLFEYYPGCIIHKKIVGWSPEKNNQLVSILKEAYIERLDSGRLLGDLDEVFDLYEEQLPQLNNNICWTRRLLTSIVLQMDSINVIGNAKRAYICKDCPEKIVSNLDELVCYVIKNIFAGGCSREDLNQWMVDHGIVIKQLTPQMFTPSHGLVMTDYECRWEGG